jgi:glycosyltransferase involved in cell wall biosynthesis/tetratricopeptide (TPR) repeat protein
MPTSSPSLDPTWLRPPDFVRAPLVSAIVPVYGAERFLAPLLDDLEAQTIADRLEILIVDTASPTAEGEIVREYQRLHSNIAYLRTEVRESSCIAENRAIQAARGKYVTLAMADDRHREDAVERLVAELESHPEASLAYADCAVTTRENQTLAAAEVVAHFRWPDFDRRLLFEVCYVGPQPVYRRSLHEYHGLYDPSFASVCDYEFWLRLVAAGERFRHVSDVLGLYLLSPNGFEHSHRGAVDAESERARRLHWRSEWGTLPKAGKSFLIPVAAATPASGPAASREAPSAGASAADARPAGTRSSSRAASSASGALVSVIMPTRDRPEWLRRAVTSVLAQTHRDLELIVVNDGGADISSVLREIDHEGRVISLRLPRPRDRSAARNAGLALARGEYVAYLDDDDWWEIDHLETVVGALEQSGDAVAYADSRYVREEKRGDGYALTGTADIPPQDFDRDRLLIGNYLPILAVVHRRSCLDEAGAFDEDLGTHEDWDLWLRLSRRHRFRHVPKVTGNISWRDDGSSTTSARGADFLRTCECIHARFAEEAAARPGVRARQESYLAAMRERAGQRAVDCTIVIAVAHGADEVAQCVDRLERVTADADYEVVVVHDGRRGDVAGRIGERASVRVVEETGARGFAALCHRGSLGARGRTIACLSDATIPWEGWLPALLAAQAAGADLVGSLLVSPDGTVSAAGLEPDAPTRRYEGQSAATPEARRRSELAAVSLAGALFRSADAPLLQRIAADADEDESGVGFSRAIRSRGGRVVFEPASVLYRIALPAEIHDQSPVVAEPEGEPAPRPDADTAEVRAALGRGDLAGARAIVDRLLARAPEDGQAWLMRGVVEIQTGDYDAARRAFERAHRNGAETRRALKGIGMATLGLGHAEEAWHVFADLLEEESDDAEAIHWLLRAGTSLQRWRALAPLLVRYLGRKPDDASVRFALAGVRLREGRLDLARVEHDRLRREAPDLAGLDELAEALAEPAPRARAAASGAQ